MKEIIKMNKFNTLLQGLSKKYNIILEQGPAPDQQSNNLQVDNQPTAINDQPIDPTALEPTTNIQQPTDSSLPTPNNHDKLIDDKQVLYTKLIYKALITDLDPSQYSELLEINDINKNNVQQILSKLETIINSQ